MNEVNKENNKKWYVVRSVSGKEKKVRQHIIDEVTRAGLTNYLSQILIPTQKVFQLKDGKKIVKERSSFPGYILIEADLMGELRHVIKNVTGVSGFLGAEKGGDPSPLRQSEVNDILGNKDKFESVEEYASDVFILGDVLKVTQGPFEGFSGIVEEIDEDKKKLKVSVKIFERKQLLELGFAQVQRDIAE